MHLASCPTLLGAELLTAIIGQDAADLAPLVIHGQCPSQRLRSIRRTMVEQRIEPLSLVPDSETG
jgi:hypothetical protein